MPDQARLFALVPRHFLRCTLEFPWFAPLENLGNPLFSLGGQAFAGLGKHFLLLLLDVVERSEEHTSELQSLMRISYAVFCLKKNNEQTKLKNYAEITIMIEY